MDESASSEFADAISNPHMATKFGFALHKHSQTNANLNVDAVLNRIADRDSLLGLIARAAYYRAVSDREKAVELYTAAISLDPELAQLYIDRADVNGRFGHNDQAYADYTRAIELYMQKDELPHKLAKVYFSRSLTRAYYGYFDEAIANLSEAIRLHPDYTDALSCRASFWRVKEDYDGAIADYTSIIQLEDAPLKRRLHALQNRGRSRMAKDDFQGAIDDLQTYLDLGGDEQFGDRPMVESYISESRQKLSGHIAP